MINIYVGGDLGWFAAIAAFAVLLRSTKPLLEGAATLLKAVKEKNRNR